MDIQDNLKFTYLYLALYLSTTMVSAQIPENLETRDLPRTITSYDYGTEELLFHYHADTPGLLSIFIDSVSEDEQLDLQVMLYDDQNHILGILDGNSYSNNQFSSNRFLIPSRGTYIVSIEKSGRSNHELNDQNIQLLIGSSWISFGEFEERFIKMTLGKTVENAYELVLNTTQIQIVNITNNNHQNQFSSVTNYWKSVFHITNDYQMQSEFGSETEEDYWKIEVPSSNNASIVLINVETIEGSIISLEGSIDLQQFFFAQDVGVQGKRKLLTIPIAAGESVVVFIRVEYSKDPFTFNDDPTNSGLSYSIRSERYLSPE